MDKLQFNHSGGFPLETDTLQKMQEAWQTLGLLAKGFGENVILSGVEFSQNGFLNTVSDGVIVINGEVLPFQGGVAGVVSNRVKVFETAENVTLKTGESVPFRKKRVARLSPEGTPLAEFIRLKNLAQVNALLDDKVDKEEGKGLSSNDFTNQLSYKLNETYNALPRIEIEVSPSGEIISNTSRLENNIVIETLIEPEVENDYHGVYGVHIEGFGIEDFYKSYISIVAHPMCNCSFETHEDHIKIFASQPPTSLDLTPLIPHDLSFKLIIQ